MLAHEIAHLFDGDSRVMGAALGPVLAADGWTREEPTGIEHRVWNLSSGY